MSAHKNPLARIASLVREEKREISAVYFYAILGGILQLTLPVGVQAIIGFVLGGAMSTSMVLLITLVVIGVLCNGLLQMNQMKVIERIQQKIFVRYAFAFADHLPKLDLHKTDGYYLPEVVNRFFEVPILQKSLSKLLLDFPIAIIQIFLGLLLLSFYHSTFILFSVVLLSILILIFYLTANKGFQTSLEKSHHKYVVAGWLEELARVVKSFKFYKATELHLKKTDTKVVDYITARKSHFSILLLQYRVLIFFKVFITAAMLVVGCLLLLDQQINIGQFVAAEIVIITVINSIEKLIVNMDSVYSVLTSMDKIEKLTDQPVEQEGKFVMQATQGLQVVLENVSYGYQPGTPIIQRFSAAIGSNEHVCIAGRDGSGKSTLLKLLTGVYSNFTGNILINGLPVGNYTATSLRSQIGIMLNQQDVFQGSLWDNLTMGEEVDKSNVLHLCEQTGLSPFIASLKNGLDTQLDPTGMRLPRNVIQKILLVRALSSQPRLVLLEEPWQGIEEQYKNQIQDLLLNGLKNTTVIVASNDIAFQKRCQQVIALPPSPSFTQVLI